MDSPRQENLHLYLKECKKHNVSDIVRVCEPQYDADEVEASGINLHVSLFGLGFLFFMIWCSGLPLRRWAFSPPRSDWWVVECCAERIFPLHIWFRGEEGGGGGDCGCTLCGWIRKSSCLGRHCTYRTRSRCGGCCHSHQGAQEGGYQQQAAFVPPDLHPHLLPLLPLLLHLLKWRKKEVSFSLSISSEGNMLIWEEDSIYTLPTQEMPWNWNGNAKRESEREEWVNFCF